MRAPGLATAYISPTVPHLGIWEVLRLSIGQHGQLHGTLAAAMGRNEWSPAFSLTGRVHDGHLILAGRDSRTHVWRFVGAITPSGLSGVTDEPWGQTRPEWWCRGATPVTNCLPGSGIRKSTR